MDSTAVKALGVFVLSLALAASAAAGAWSPSERLEIARAGLAAATAGDLVYVGGGAAAGDPANAFDVFDGNKESWRPLPALPKGLINFAMAASDRFVFIAGGFAADAPGEPRKDIWAYDIESASWSRQQSDAARARGPRDGGAGGLVYVVGGSGPSAERTLVYNPQTDKWTIGAVLGVPRRALAAATDGKRIYAVGGIKGDGGVSNAFEMFDPASGVWAAHAAIAGRARCADGGDHRQTIACRGRRDVDAAEDLSQSRRVRSRLEIVVQRRRRFRPRARLWPRASAADVGG